MIDLEDTVAIVTGAGSGIGRAIATAFAELGMSLALVGRRKDKLLEVNTTLPENAGHCYPCDIADRAAVMRLGEEVLDRFGRVDVLVNNAGINTRARSTSNVAPEDWDRTLAINLTGAFNCVRTVLPAMRERKSGLIINISSTAGKQACKLAGVAYSASKHGLVALTQSINAEESTEFGIRASVVCPGEVDTPILEQRPKALDEAHRQRILRPEDVAAAVVFLAGLHPRVCVPELIIKPTAQS